MDKKRRDFLKMTTAVSALLIPKTTKADETPCDPEFNDVFGILVDTTVCIGCRKCENACNQQNELTNNYPSFYEDKSVFLERRRPSVDALTVVNASNDSNPPKYDSFIKIQCMHCNNPACVSACIVGALTKCQHGVVSYDAWKCIGCRYCMVACPFQIPTYEYAKAFQPQIMKCTFCTELVHEGEKPSCVEACPVEALTFGKRGDLIKLGHSKIKQHPEKYIDHVYGETEIGGTSWMYLAGKEFDEFDLPTLEDRPIPELTETIQHGIFKSFLPPIVLYGLLGLVMYSLKDENKQEVIKDDV